MINNFVKYFFLIIFNFTIDKIEYEVYNRNIPLGEALYVYGTYSYNPLGDTLGNGQGIY